MARVARAAALAIVLLAAYANSFGTQLVLDAPLLVDADPRVQSLDRASLREIFTGSYWNEPGSSLYRPLTTTSFAVANALADASGSDRALAQHVLAFALHVANALLVVALLGGLGLRREPAWLGGALFGLHPIATEAVTNVAGRADLLAAGFVLLALLASRAGSRAAGARRLVLAGLVGGCVLLGLLSKESGIAALGLLPLLALADERREGLLRSARAKLPEAVACALALLVWALLRRHALGTAPPRPTPLVDNPLLGLDFVAWQLSAYGVLGRGLALLVWPGPLSADYSHAGLPLFSGQLGDPGTQAALLSLAVLLALAALGVRLLMGSGAQRALGFLVLFYLGAVFPVSNVALRIGTIFGERLLYLPLVGFAGLAAWGLVEGASAIAVRLAWRPAGGRVLAGTLALAVCLAYGARTAARNADWRSAQTLLEAATRARPGSYRPHHALAAARFDAARVAGTLEQEILTIIAEAERAFDIVESLPPEDRPLEVIFNLGTYHLMTFQAMYENDPARAGHLQRAFEVYRAGFDPSPDFDPRTSKRSLPALFTNLAVASLELGKIELAERALARALALSPALSQDENVEHLRKRVRAARGSH